jgi:hypothetical protein
LDEIVTKAVQNMVETKGKRLDRRDIEAAIGMEIADLPSRKKLRKKDQIKVIPPEMPVEKEEAAMDNENSDLVINPTKPTDVPIEMPITSHIIGTYTPTTSAN